MAFYKIFGMRSISQNTESRKRTMEKSIILGEVCGGIVQSYLFRGKSLAGNCPWRNFMATKVQGGFSKGNYLKVRLRKANVLEGVS